MAQMDYGLLMRRVMAQLALVADGGTVQLEPSRGGADHPSRLLSNGQDERPLKDDDRQEILHVSIYWLQAQWHRAHSDRRKRALLHVALGILRLARIRTKAKHDLATQDGRIALEDEVLLTDDLRKTAAHYGYSIGGLYEYLDRARRRHARARDERERALYDGTVEMRVRIAAEPGTLRAVADQFGVSHTAVRRWRLEHHEKG